MVAGRPRRRRSPRARGRRLGTRREPAVVALPRSRAAAGTAYPAPGTPRPATPVSAATCRSRWSTRRAWTSRRAASDVVLIAGAETWRTRTRLRASGAKPDWTSQDDSVPIAAGRRRRHAMAGPVGSPHPPGPARLRLPDVRAGAADRGGGVARRPPPPHRRAVVAIQRGRGDEPARVEPRAVVGRTRSGKPGPTQPDDQLAVHQADELQQHGRSGRGAGPDVGREGDVSPDPSRPVGVPVRGHRRARHLRDRRARGVPPVACHQDRGQAGAGTGGCRHRRHRHWSTSTRASRRRCRWRPTNSACRPAIPAGR